jgi:hypothetical protein
VEVAVSDSQPATVPFAAQAVPFQEMLATGKIPDGLITSPYVHYVLSVPAGSYSIANLGKLLEQVDPRQQVFFFKRLKETSPDSLTHFAPLYYGFMSEFSELLFT